MQQTRLKLPRYPMTPLSMNKQLVARRWYLAKIFKNMIHLTELHNQLIRLKVPMKEKFSLLEKTRKKQIKNQAKRNPPNTI
jgi:hypothetical protein